MIADKKYYLDCFGVTEQDLEKLLAAAMERGGDYADLFFENTSCSDLMIRDGEVSSGGFNVDYGVGIRVLNGEKTGYAYSESTEPSAMLCAAKAAGAIAEAGAAPESEDKGSAPKYRGKPNPAADRYPMNGDWRNCPVSELAPYLRKLDTLIRAKDTRVVKLVAGISSQVSDILMFNSFGELKYDTRPMGSISATVVFEQDGKIENKYVGRSFRTGTDMLGDDIIEELASKAVAGIDERFEAKRPKGGKMDVVMGAGASGILLHEAIGHAFEADFNRKGQSIFSDKMGSRICPENISVIDDGTICGNRGSVNFDDEGVPGQKTYMVENGILTSYLHDRISANWYGVKPTGNGRRESFRYAPIPRMRATYMEGGESTPEEIIASVKKGIYVNEFSNGQVKIGEGDFTFFVKSGFLIENGHLTSPVKDINIIGNGPEALAGITMVGNDPTIDNGTWTCGKEQSVPVSCGIPTVLVKQLTVGGE